MKIGKIVNVVLLLAGTVLIIAGVIADEWILAVPGDILVIAGVLLFFLYFRERPGSAPQTSTTLENLGASANPPPATGDQPPEEPAA